MTREIYNAEIQVLRWFGHKHIFGLPEDQLRQWLAHNAAQRSTAVPKLLRLHYQVRDQLIAGRPCPVISPRKTTGTKGWARSNRFPSRHCRPVVLFLHGGGFIFEALFAHWMAVDRIIARTHAEVWFAAYPLLPEATIYESHDMVYATWQRLIQEHDPGSITIVGDSAGATLALTLTHALREQGQALPRQLILASPAQTRVDAQLRAQMEAFAPLDVMIPMSLLDALEHMMPERPQSPLWLLRPLEGTSSETDSGASAFSGFPPVMVLAGTHEVFYPLMPDFLQRLADAEVPAEFISGEGLCHVWPYIPAAPECLKGLDRMIAAIHR